MDISLRLDQSLLKELNENKVYLEFIHILEQSTSVTMVSQIMEIVLTTLKCSSCYHSSLMLR